MSDHLGTEHEGETRLIISGEGVRVETTPGLPARSRGTAPGAGDALAHAIERSDGVRTIASATITRLDLVPQGNRGATGDDSILVKIDRATDDERQVVLVQEGGRYTWAIPRPDADHVSLPIEALPGSRGFLPKSVHRVVHLIGVKTVGWAVKKATSTFVGAWDQRHHPHGLRSWTPDNHRLAGVGEPDWGALTRGPALLVVHGFTGSVHGSFGDLPVEVVGRIHDAYDGRTFAFDHPTMAVSPRANAEWLHDRLRAAKVPLQLDILAHSRGGLIAREMAQRLAGGGIGVRSVTFVATPNAGTPLADPKRPTGLLDALTNLVGAVPGSDIVELVLELLKDVVVESALEGLEGLLAMAPGGAYLSELNRLAVPPDLVVRSISADFEPRSSAGIVETARNRAVDLYFGGLRNDLIVPTLSPIVTDGPFSVPSGQRLVLDSSRGVDHSSFWTNPRAIQQLTAWLRPDWPERPPALVPAEESEPGAETALAPDPRRIKDVVKAVAGLPTKVRKGVESVLGGPINAQATPPTGARPAVVVVPGIMGSHLAGASGDLVWLDAFRLRRGHFIDLRLPAGPEAALHPAGVNTTYLPLISHLAESWDVYLAPFDWRVDIRTSAARLATVLRDEVFPTSGDRPVHIVAHSMGGLVARAMAFVAPKVWAEMGAGQRASEAGASGRLVMLGTPNKGSFATVLLLSGAEMILKALAAVDIRNDAKQLRDVVASFPGVYQMLPSPMAEPADDDHRELFDAASWTRGSQLSQELLAAAEAFHQEMAVVHDPERLVYVAGYDHPTPFRLEIAGGAFTLGVSRRGDGRVALPLGQLDGVTTFYSHATHGGLPSDPAVLDALAELLATGRTKDLPAEEPVRRGEDALDRPPMIPIEAFDPGMATRGDAPGDPRAAEALLEDAVRLALGGGPARRERARLEIGVLHASLEQARHPVAVGHYTGLPPGGAERFLDHKLDGALRARQRTGQYPDRPASAMYIPVQPGRRPRGGLVLGLGEFGTLTKATLTESMAQAVIALILDERQRTAPSEEPASVGISSVLIGIPGRHGLSVESSVVALTEGVLEAISRLTTLEPPITLGLVELELVELYEQPAEEAAGVVCRIADLLEPSLAGQVDVVPRIHLRSGEGGQPSAPPRDASGTPWVRVTVGLEALEEGTPPTTIRRMRFSTLARGAQSNLMEYDIDLDKVSDYVAAAVRRPDDDHNVSRTLYELLFPVRAKLDLDRSESLHLLVDEAMAEVPWELLAAASVSGAVTPLALRAGMLRQLQSNRHTRERSQAPSGRMALVIGDPPTAGFLPPLPGASREAGLVEGLLLSHEWEVEALIYDGDDNGDHDEWAQVLDALNRHPYRVVHIAAHGVFDAADARRSGVVIGPKPHHRLTALEFEKMTVTPDLVFLNCCHLGRFDDLSKALTPADRRTYEQPHRMAATVAQQLLGNGVRAVVVAGWAVDDAAAMTFAETLYATMLDGHPFGDAVHRARVAAHQADSGMTNTWGAYQCYGDPDFLLVAEESVPTKESPIVSPAQLAREFRQQAAQAGNSTTQSHCHDVRRRVDALRVAGKELLDDAAVLEALGDAYGELGRYEDAVFAYLRSLRQDGAGVRLRAIEQLVNFEVRSAMRMVVAGVAPPEATALLDRTCDRLTQLEALAGSTAERHALRGSLEKKRATTLVGTPRTKALTRARVAYRAAWELSSEGHGKRLDSYHTNLWLQLSALTARSGKLVAKEAEGLDRLYDQVLDDPGPDRTGYWQLASVADTLVTAIVVDQPLRGATVTLADVKAQYRAAFDLRSTVRQRASSLDHLADLSRLLPDARGKGLGGLCEEMSDGG